MRARGLGGILEIWGRADIFAACGHEVRVPGGAAPSASQPALPPPQQRHVTDPRDAARLAGRAPPLCVLSFCAFVGANRGLVAGFGGADLGGFKSLASSPSATMDGCHGRACGFARSWSILSLCGFGFAAGVVMVTSLMVFLCVFWGG